MLNIKSHDPVIIVFNTKTGHEGDTGKIIDSYTGT